MIQDLKALDSTDPSSISASMPCAWMEVAMMPGKACPACPASISAHSRSMDASGQALGKSDIKDQDKDAEFTSDLSLPPPYCVSCVFSVLDYSCAQLPSFALSSGLVVKNIDILATAGGRDRDRERQGEENRWAEGERV